MSVVTRIAPSPTGFMHIGTARTALFSWLYARGRGGKFLLRIEDTDRDRNNPEAVDAIKSGMKWLGLDWDGDVLFQFERKDRHVEIAQALVEKGAAYYCYCSPEELEAMREQAMKEGRSQFYDRRWRDRDPKDAPAGVKPVIRIKAPLHGDSIVDDAVQGSVVVDSRNLDDFILLRSDGTPTYMLAVVVDDYDMGVTHVIRGNEHFNNTFRQKLIIEAMGWQAPTYAHIPLIHGPDGAKLSKRHGAQSVEEYRDMGYLPEAMRNYLLRLGWGHGDDEIISTEQAIEWFDLSGIVKSPARFDFAKLESLNAHYMKEADDARLVDLVAPLIEKNHRLALTPQSRAWLLAGMHDLKLRSKTLVQLAADALFYARPLPFAYDDKALKTLKEPESAQALDLLGTRLAAQEEWSDRAIEDLAHAIANEIFSAKLGKVAMPLRAALTGSSVSPPIFKAAEILGREEVIRRIDAAKSIVK